MNKREYAEFHKYLALLIYEYNVTLDNPNLSYENRLEIEKVLDSLNTVMKICIIDGK